MNIFNKRNGKYGTLKLSVPMPCCDWCVDRIKEEEKSLRRLEERLESMENRMINDQQFALAMRQMDGSIDLLRELIRKESDHEVSYVTYPGSLRRLFGELHTMLGEATLEAQKYIASNSNSQTDHSPQNRNRVEDGIGTMEREKAGPQSNNVHKLQTSFGFGLNGVFGSLRFRRDACATDELFRTFWNRSSSLRSTAISQINPVGSAVPR